MIGGSCQHLLLEIQRICQVRIQENQPKIIFNEVDKLQAEDRGGIGSTGTK